ncbi:MAG: cupin domain-containing protein [Planctomycetota bacterium]
MPRTVRIEPQAPPLDWRGTDITFPVTTHDTGGRLSLQRTAVPPSSTNPPHCHGQEDEVFFIESGRMIARIPGSEHVLNAGDLVYLPRGIPHQLTNTDTPSTLLTLLAPGAIEHAFRAGIEEPDRLADEMRIYGVHILDELVPYQHPMVPVPSTTPFVVRADEGDAYRMAGDEYRIKVPSERIDGRFSVVRFTVPPGGGPTPHVHSEDEEIVHILEGACAFYADRDTLRASAGQTVVLPRHIPHAFRNTSDRPASFLTVTTPGGFDRFVRACGNPASPGASPPPPDADEIARIAAAAPDYGVTMRPDINWDPSP